MTSPPRHKHGYKNTDEDDSECDNSSNMDEYFVGPNADADVSAYTTASLPSSYTRETSQSRDKLSQRSKDAATSRSWTPKLRRRSPPDKAGKPNESHQQVVSKGSSNTAFGSVRDGARRVVFRSPPPKARFPFFTRHERATTPLKEDDEANEESDDDDSHTSLERRVDSSPPRSAVRFTDEKRERFLAMESQGRQPSLNDELTIRHESAYRQDSPLPEEVVEPPYKPATLLHQACLNASTVDDLASINKKHLTTKAAGTSDDLGQTPMHVLANNYRLAQNLAAVQEEESRQHSAFETNFESPTGAKMRHFVVGVLLKTYQQAMLTCDSQGCIPFEGSLVEWVNQAHETLEPALDSNGDASAMTPSRMSSLSSMFMPSTSFAKRWSIRSSSLHRNASSLHAVPEDQQPESGRDVEAPAGTPSLSPRHRARMRQIQVETRERSFPTNVALTAHAHFCFQMLSAILDQLERLAKKTEQEHHSLKLHTTEDEDSSHAATIQELKKSQCVRTVQDIISEIIRSIASIPDLVKTVLLMQDDAQRNYVLSTSIFRRVLMSKYSIGRWLTGMLQCDERRVWEQAVFYLKLASDPSVFMSEPAVSSLRSSTPSLSNTKKTNEEPDELYQEVSRLQDFVPSLLSLGEAEVEEAATTILVRRVLDRIISRPFTVTVIFFDALFLAILIFGFRMAVNRLLLGASPREVLSFIYVANAGIFYFVIRELGKAVCLMTVTRRARTYFWSFWNLTDLLSTALALISTVSIRAMFISQEDTNMETSVPLRNLLAITTGFLWLRVLNFLKGINMQLATFVLAILQITRDILWFCVILLTLVVCFAQMFFTLMVPESCTLDESDDTQECAQSEYYLKVYAILLGDFGTFERENFTSFFPVLLIVVYSFMVVLVLLNILIAVASDSYEKCLVRSQNLFGRARVMMIAELVSFQNLLKRNALPDAPTSDTRWIYKTWWSKDSWAHGWSRASIVFFSLSSLTVFIWVIGEMAGYFSGPQYGNVFLSLGSIFINVALFICIMTFLSTGAADIIASRKNIASGEDDASSGEGQSRPRMGACYERFTQRIMQLFLGSSHEKDSGLHTGDGWRGRLVFVQRELNRISDETKADSSAKSNKLEHAIQQTEVSLRSEVTHLETQVAGLRTEVQEALRLADDRQREQDELHATMRQVLQIFRDEGVNRE